MKIYVPDLKYKCFVVQSEGVIRGYEQIPTYNGNYAYRDYYINSSYIYRDGVQQFSTYSTFPTCLSSDVLTDSYYYRNDFDRIMIILFIFLFIVFFIFKKFVRVFFHGFRWC